MVNRMAYLRHVKGKTIMDVAYDLDLPITTYQQYESGLREPSFKTLIAIANYYDCTLDYLLCRTEVFEQPTQKDMDLAFQLNRLLEPDDIAALNTLISHLKKEHDD